MSSADLAYYSFDKVLSYNGVFNFIIGARGLGKTYGAKRKVIRDGIRYGREFIYLRRYKTELHARNSFFADIAHEFPEHQFRVNGQVAQVCEKTDEIKPRWRTIGHFAALSNAQSKKSVAYPNVHWIIYDEFIIEKGALHYLPNETERFQDFYSTVDRWQDRTRVLFLANALTIMNPYFLTYKIEPKRNEEIVVKNDGFIVAHFPVSSEFQSGVSKTRFGKFIKGTEYGEYSIVSQFHDNHDRLLAKKPSSAVYLFTLDSPLGICSIWRDYGDPPTWYAQEKLPGQQKIFTLVSDHVGLGMILIRPSDRLLGVLRLAYSRGQMRFDTPTTRQAFAGACQL